MLGERKIYLVSQVTVGGFALVRTARLDRRVATDGRYPLPVDRPVRRLGSIVEGGERSMEPGIRVVAACANGRSVEQRQALSLAYRIVSCPLHDGRSWRSPRCASSVACVVRMA